MSLYEWHFRLEGDETDIVSITDIFSLGANISKDSDGHNRLIMELPFTRTESQAARETAEGLLALLNAVAQIHYGNHDNVRISGVGCRQHPDEPLHLYIQMSASIKGRTRVSANLTIANSNDPVPIAPPPIGDRILSAAEKDHHLERALYLFGCLPLDWRGLYMVLDAIREGNGGLKGLKTKNWVPASQIENFKATADSYKAIGAAARHGKINSGIDKPRLTLQEARDMVRTILEKWAKASM
jgi:hypothetical protein